MKSVPNRYLREGIVASKRVSLLSWPAEVFYRRLMSVVDDFGRYYATPSLLRAACYPRQLAKVSDTDVGKWLGETRKAALVGVYQSGGEDFLVMLDFRQQKRAVSKFPDPPEPSKCNADAEQVPADAKQLLSIAKQVRSNAKQMRTYNEDEDEDENSVAASAPLVLMPLVDGTEAPVTEAMVEEWRTAYPAIDVLQELRKMRTWCLANPKNCKTARGVGKFMNAWLGRQQDKGSGTDKSSGLPSYT